MLDVVEKRYKINRKTITWITLYKVLVFLQEQLLGDKKEHLFKSSSLSKFEKQFTDAAKRQG